MTALDDYPPPHNAGGSAHEQHERMCAEIDRLRALHDAVWDPEWEDVDGTVHEVIAHLRRVTP